MFVNKKISSAIRISEFHCLAIYAPRDKSNKWIPTEKKQAWFFGHNFSAKLSKQSKRGKLTLMRTRQIKVAWTARVFRELWSLVMFRKIFQIIIAWGMCNYISFITSHVPINHEMKTGHIWSLKSKLKDSEISLLQFYPKSGSRRCDFSTHRLRAGLQTSG